jgi:hypothetical protein
MKSVLAAYVLFLLTACASAPTAAPSPGVKSAGHLLIPKDRYFGGQRFASEWTPAASDIASLEAALARRLSRDHAELADYLLRFAAVTENGRRLLIGDASHKDLPNSGQFLTPPGGDTVLLRAFGGGSTFFRFRYDAGRRHLDEFAFNAPL